MKSHLQTYLIIVAVAAASFMSSGSVAWAQDNQAASLLPAETVFYVTVPNVSDARRKLEETSLGGLYVDPAMQSFIEPAEKAVVKELKRLAKQLWMEMELPDAPETFPCPTGRAILALRAGEADGSPEMAIIAEFGENRDAYRDTYAKLLDQWSDTGGDRRRKDVRGGTIDILTKVTTEESGPQERKHCFAEVDDTVLYGDEAFLEDILALMDGSDLPSLADDENHADTLRTLKGPGECFVYVNSAAVVHMLRNEFGSKLPDGQFEKMIHNLGLTNITGAGVAMEVVPDGAVDFRLRGLLAIDGTPRGVPALLTPADIPTTPPTTVTKGVATFSVLNYDLAAIYDNALWIAMAATGQPVGMIVQSMMTATAQNDPAGRPPVNLRDDVLAQITGPIVVWSTLTPPHTDPANAGTAAIASVGDEARIDEALSRLHETFVARGRPDMRRELLDTTMYLLTGMFGAEDPDADTGAVAVAVAGDNLILSGESVVAQAIRDLRRSDLESIESDPTYRYAARYLPAQAGVWTYENTQLKTKAAWTLLKHEAANSLFNPQRPKSDDDTARIDVGIGYSRRQGVISPMENIMEDFQEYCDFNLLPEFEGVKKYFGPSVSYLRQTEKGLYFESITLKAPPAR